MEQPNYSPAPLVDEDGSVTLYIYGNVTPESISRLIQEIQLHGNAPSIQLRIKTNGGDLNESFAAWDIIQEYGVNTHLDGFGFSGGFILFLAGVRRTMHVSAKLMHHEMRYTASGTLTAIEREAAEMRRRQNVIDKYIMQQTKITKHMLQTVYNEQRDWYIDFEQALELGFITDVLVITEEMQEIMVTVPCMEDPTRDVEMAMEMPVREAAYVTLEEYYEILKERAVEEGKNSEKAEA